MEEDNKIMVGRLELQEPSPDHIEKYGEKVMSWKYKWKSTGKYSPHQGKQECERRAFKNANSN